MANTALVAGATGLIGQHLVTRLPNSGVYARIKVLARRPLRLEDSRIKNLVSVYTARYFSNGPKSRGLNSGISFWLSGSAGRDSVRAPSNSEGRRICTAS